MKVFFLFPQQTAVRCDVEPDLVFPIRLSGDFIDHLAVPPFLLDIFQNLATAEILPA